MALVVPDTTKYLPDQKARCISLASTLCSLFLDSSVTGTCADRSARVTSLSGPARSLARVASRPKVASAD